MPGTELFLRPVATSRPLRSGAAALAIAPAVVALVAGCAPRVRPLTLPAPFAADSQTTRIVAPGLVQRSVYIARGAWAIHTLDVDPRRCWKLEATKSGNESSGRLGTLALARAMDAAGGVNADFFSLTAPTGVPAGLFIRRGGIVTGPSQRPSFWIGHDGRPRIGTTSASGWFVAGRDSIAISGWNRAAARGVAYFDNQYGARTDSVPGRLYFYILEGDEAVLLDHVDSGAVATIDRDKQLLAVAPNAPPAVIATLRRLTTTHAAGHVHVAVSPNGIVDAVSGNGVLVRDGAVTADVDTVGNAGFRGRNPRTAVGIMPNGHIVLAVVDGRQPGYSDGMSLRELADLFVALGARDALNLDGGGSSTIVARGIDGTLHIVNKPSDKEGERPVGNALVVRACTQR